MTMDIPLLDVLSMKAGCEYLSDLRALDAGRRGRLARVLEQISARSADLREWNDALLYLSREPPQETAEAARERLIFTLSDKL